LNLEENNK